MRFYAVLLGKTQMKVSISNNLSIFLASQGAEIKLCTSCVKARGLLDAKLIDGVTLGTLDDVSEWTLWADKVLTF